MEENYNSGGDPTQAKHLIINHHIYFPHDSEK